MASISVPHSAEAVGHRTRSEFATAFWSLIAVVFALQLAVALWLNSKAFLWGDAESRAASALITLYSADPHLAAIGFVWMPLPTVIELIPVAFYPLWPGVVSSGFAASIVSVLSGTLTAAIVYGTARRLNLSKTVGVAYALVVSLNPMFFLYATNGMSEGIATPFMVGSVCCLVVFWFDGQRRYVAGSGIMLMLSFACLYQAAHFGAALLFALVVGLYAAENAPSAPQGRLRAIEGLSILLLVPSAYFAFLWIVANAAIMGDPLYFATSSYSNEGYIAAAGVNRLADTVTGDPLGSAWFVIERTLPFMVPVFFILAVRLIEGRLIRLNTMTLLGLALVVPIGLILPQVYGGQSFGWLRYFMYPLFVAAGWGLYEIATSNRRRMAMGLVFAGWLLLIPASLWAMSDPQLGQSEYQIVRSLLNGNRANEVGYPLYFDDVEPVAQALDALPGGSLVMVDSSNAWTVAAEVTPHALKHKMLFTSDDRFRRALADPGSMGVSHLLVPDPAIAPQDLLNSEYEALWSGNDSRFELVRDFVETGVHWKLYRVVD